jgi:hypothetical protein
MLIDDRHAELVSAPHLQSIQKQGLHQAGRLSCGVLKQVQHDGWFGGYLMFNC